MRTQLVKNTNDKCLSCGSNGTVLYPQMEDHLFGVKGFWALNKCKNCGLVWLDPKPSPDEIAGFYKVYHTHKAVEYIPLIMIIASRKIPAILMGYRNGLLTIKDRAWGILFSLIGPLREVGKRSVMWLNAHPGGKLLDIGCGNGIFLSKMKAYGWDVAGVETDPKAVMYARDKFKLENIHLGSLENAILPDETFDALTMNHVIEHLLDPIDTLKTCFRILKPGGRLVITTPNAESLGAMHFKDLWRGWEPPRHIHIFSPKSMRLIVEKAGFQVVSNTSPSSASFSIWLLSLLLQKKVFMKQKNMPMLNKKLKLKSAIIWFIEDVLCRLGIYRSEELALLARKPY